MRTVLAVARAGTHSGAARSLALTQTTVSRRIQALESQLGTPLFERQAGVLSLTKVGARIASAAESMEQQALAANRHLEADTELLEGSVTVALSDWLAVHLQPRVLATLQDTAPRVRVHCVTGPALVNLVQNEADLALRPQRFEAQGIWQRAITQVQFSLYASRAYLAQHGMPHPGNGALGHRLAQMDDDAGPIAEVAWLRQVAYSANVVTRADGRLALASLATGGLVMACLPSVVGAAHNLTPIQTLGSPPSRTLWLGVHRDRKNVARVRAVVSAIAETCPAAATGG